MYFVPQESVSLYQKYRPQDFHSLYWQTFVKEALSSAIEKQKTTWAYLFCGSRGTGKTTVARILAKALNCTDLQEGGNPCGKCDHCLAFANNTMLDVVEIDAASHTGVDNVRELIERAQFAPSSGEYKIYIIDEVHMLSKWAFNALLKTLEEPPKHVKFILATTEIHRIPETILSRVQRYDFRKIPLSDITARLRFVADSEKIDAEEEALELIAKLARGGMRDALSLFEQYSVSGTLSRSEIENRLGLIREEDIAIFFDAITKGDAKKSFALLDTFFEKIVDARVFIEQLLSELRLIMLDKIASNEFLKYSRIFDVLFETYSRLKITPDQKLILDAATAKLLKEFSP